MPLESMISVVDQAFEMGENMGFEPYIYLTGGDPLLHPQFWELANYLHEKDALWAVMGNPFHLSPEVCTHLKQLGCRKYQLSLDGMEETHDAFRMPGSFQCTLRALKMLADANIWTAVMTTVSSANAKEIPNLIDLMAQLEVDVYAFSRYCPTSGQRRDEFHMEAQEYRNFLLACQARIDAHEAAGCKTTFQRKDHLWTLLEYEQGRFTIPESAKPDMIYDGCHCACSHMTITPTGNIYGCRRMESLVGNVFESQRSGQPALQSIFLGEKMDALRSFDAFEKCSRCELLGWCRGCPAVAAGYTGNPYAPDPQCWKEVS
jgi:radical SAM/SPASM domain protein of ACGX system